MNTEEIVARLRQTESRSKRKLLDEAADAIEELAKASIFKRIPCEVDPRKEYVELDGIRLVCEEGQIVGWYRPGDGLIDANKAITKRVDVVRCRECKHRYEDAWCEYVDDDDNFYCARGEWKGGAENA